MIPAAAKPRDTGADDSSPVYRWIRWGATLLITGFAIGFAVLILSVEDLSAWLRSIPPGLRFMFWPAMVVLPLLGFPISILYLGAALLFPMWLAITLGVICLALNMTLGYWLGNTLWHDFTLRQIERRFPDYSGLSVENAFRTVVLVRSLPGIPYFLQNYVLAVLNVRFSLYLWCSLVIQGGFLSGIVLTLNGTLKREPFLALSGGLLVILMLLLIRRTLEIERRKAALNPSLPAGNR